jgi:hypothetical protein
LLSILFIQLVNAGIASDCREIYSPEFSLFIVLPASYECSATDMPSVKSRQKAKASLHRAKIFVEVRKISHCFD